jgi:HK97 gp10 family phage protein
MTIRIDGLTEAKATLDALPQAFRDVASETISEGADIIWSEAFSRAPVGSGKDVHPGKLKQSIGKNIRSDGLQAAIGSGVDYAKFEEFGTSDTPAQPFLYPAFRIGARFVRGKMRDWADDAGNRAKFKTKRGREK